MALVCPAVLAADQNSYHDQMTKVAGFAHRVQIDLADERFAPTKTVQPEQAWWPVGVRADFHLMLGRPASAVSALLRHRPHLIIVHAEAEGEFPAIAEACKSSGVKIGVALLQDTPPQAIVPALGLIDHVLIFSGRLGQFGGQADLGQLNKVAILKAAKAELEIGWDGGVNDQNAAGLVLGGVDVLNVGGYIQNAEQPQRAYQALQRIADETGAT